MANPAFISALKSDRCAHYLNNTLVKRAQSFDVSAQVPTEIIDELGNEKHAGIISAPAEVTFALSVFDTGLDLTRTLIGDSGANQIALDRLMNARVDYVGVVRDNSGNFFRSVYVKDAVINSLNYGFDVAGNATEAYGFVGDNLTVLDGFVVTKEFVIAATGSDFSLEASDEPIQTKADSYFEGTYLLRVTKKESGISTTLNKEEYVFTPGTKKISPAGGVKKDQVWTVVFYTQNPACSPSPDFGSVLPPAVRGEFTPLSIGVTGKEQIPRLQSAKIQVGFQQLRVPQLGSRQVLHAPGGVPQVSGSFNVLMNDLSLRKLLTYGSSSSGETQFGIEQLAGYGIKEDMGLEIVIKSPTDNEVVLKRISVPDIVTQTGGMPASVKGTLMETYGWSGKTGSLVITNS